MTALVLYSAELDELAITRWIHGAWWLEVGPYGPALREPPTYEYDWCVVGEL